MSIKAIFMDMDGTVLTSEHKVSDKLKNKLNELEEKGIKIFVATGRSYSGTKRYLELIGIKNPVITYNGGRIVNPLTDEVVYENAIKPEIVEKIIKLAREKDIHLNLYNEDKLYFERNGGEGEKYAAKTGMPFEVVNFDDFIGKNSTKGLLLAPNDKLLELKEELEKSFEGVYFVFSQPTYLEILNEGVNKGGAVRELLKQYGISADEAMAFGDQLNDLEMLKTVKYGYLMGNATDELKKEFPKDRITLTNDEDGIYEVIKEL